MNNNKCGSAVESRTLALPNCWLDDRPPARISQNTMEGTGNIKLEVESWEIAQILVSSGIVTKGKKCQVGL